jgi:hypothetical protein
MVAGLQVFLIKNGPPQADSSNEQKLNFYKLYKQVRFMVYCHTSAAQWHLQRIMKRLKRFTAQSRSVQLRSQITCRCPPLTV